MLAVRSMASLALLILLGCFPSPVAATVCPDDPEVNLCDANNASQTHMVSNAPSRKVAAHHIAFPLALALHFGGAKHGAWVPLLVPPMSLASCAPVASAMTCGELKTHFNTEQCCGEPDKVLSQVPGAADCPYNFEKPACDDAEPQAPRDLTANAIGLKMPKAVALTEAQAALLPLTNVHYHLGAEHRSEEYSDNKDSVDYDSRRLGGHSRRLDSKDVRPGFMCPTSGLTTDQKASYDFKHCKGDVQVGKSYEVHYVHSSAGYAAQELVGADIDGIDDGLGGAANGRGMLNPMVVVQGQVFLIVSGGPDVDNMLDGWTVVNHTDSVMYPGSTTGQSHDNEVCSPYTITWHVDKACHQVSPASFDNLCKQMKEKYALEADLYPHGSRKLVDSKYVVPSDHVTPLA